MLLFILRTQTDNFRRSLSFDWSYMVFQIKLSLFLRIWVERLFYRLVMYFSIINLTVKSRFQVLKTEILTALHRA